MHAQRSSNSFVFDSRNNNVTALPMNDFAFGSQSEKMLRHAPLPHYSAIESVHPRCHSKTSLFAERPREPALCIYCAMHCTFPYRRYIDTASA